MSNYEYELSELEKQILEDIIEDPKVGRTTVSKKYDIPENTSRKIVKKIKDILHTNEFADVDEAYEALVKKNAQLERQKQRLQDQQRIERKIRQRIRTENALEDFTKDLLYYFETHENNYVITPPQEHNEDIMGIFQISDAHFNELIELDNNHYDFNVAAKRLQKYVKKAIHHFKSHNVTKILVVMTGDMLNSDRRLDELLNMCTNRAKATVLSTYLLEQVIVDLAQHFEVTITYVTGNESRAGEFMGSSEMVVSDNYDLTIYEMLKLIFKNQPVNFIDGASGEKVVSVNEKNILLMHGQQLNKNVCKQVQQIKGKYSDKGIKIDYVIFGHIHECLIADGYARSSSLCGANAYSDYTLQLTSRASQNLHLVSKQSIDSIKIDLQEYDEYPGYSVDKELESYNAKSIKKGKEEKFIIVNVL